MSEPPVKEAAAARESEHGLEAPARGQARTRRRPLIAVLIHYIERTAGGYEQLLRRALIDACAQHDFDLVIVAGSAFDHPSPEMRVQNQIYELVDSTHFDGLILVPAGLCTYSGTEGLLARLRYKQPHAMVSLGLALPGVPSVVCDNRIGLEDAVEHLISHHGRTKLAFMGSIWDFPDANQRRDVFLEVTARHGLKVPDQYMLDCRLEPMSAEAATARFLADDPDIDGIVAANDGAAWGAIRAVLDSGRRVPEDVVVTGYDDLPRSRLLQPSLTTVSQPVAAMARVAVELLALQLASKPAVQVATLPSALVVRRSCGCSLEPNQALTASELIDAAHESYKERLHIESMYGQIFETGRRLNLAFSSAELVQQISESLPRLHPQDYFIGFYSDESHQLFRPLPKQQSQQPYVRADASFLHELGDLTHPRALLMLGLEFRAQLFGVIAFEMGTDSFDYPALCDHLVSAWQVVKLHEEVIQQTKLNERSLQERHAAADRSRAMSTMASGVAHDLNNALGSLVALSDVVSDEIQEHRTTGRAINPDTAEDLRAIKSSALRATETIKDLMTLGRVGRTRQEPFDVIRLTRRLVEEQRGLLAKGQAPAVELSFDTNERSLVVDGSEPHVERAVGNVLRNAVESAGPGGRVDVSVAPLDLDRSIHGYESIPAGRYAVVSIADNGPGIAVEDRRRLFEPFFSTKRLGESSGSGLGLAIVHSVVKEHQGFVDVESQLGSGARFSLYFPSADGVPNAKRSSPPVAMGSARILVVDDDLTQLRTAKRVLTRCGYEVTTLSSGARAYDLFEMELSQRAARASAPPPSLDEPTSGDSRRSSYDLLILDLALNEEADGLEIFNKIRAIFPDQKGILASGHAFVDREEQIRAAQLIWLPKPYTIESLTNAVRVALRG